MPGCEVQHTCTMEAGLRGSHGSHTLTMPRRRINSAACGCQRHEVWYKLKYNIQCLVSGCIIPHTVCCAAHSQQCSDVQVLWLMASLLFRGHVFNWGVLEIHGL